LLYFDEGYQCGHDIPQHHALLAFFLQFFILDLELILDFLVGAFLDDGFDVFLAGCCIADAAHVALDFLLILPCLIAVVLDRVEQLHEGSPVTLLVLDEVVEHPEGVALGEILYDCDVLLQLRGVLIIAVEQGGRGRDVLGHDVLLVGLDRFEEDLYMGWEVR
jgi:hypothetical protein